MAIGVIKEILKRHAMIDGDNKPVFKNMAYLFLTQFINYIFPFVTMKYLIVTIGLENFGLISFVQSFILYFTIFTDYGFNITATRDIARSDSSEEVAAIFSSTITAKILLLLLSTVIYTILVLTVSKFSANESLYFLFWGVVIGGCLFPQWYFQGVQKMGYITIVNVIIKVILLLSVLVFVKSPYDTLLVPAIYSVSFILPGVYALYLAWHDLNSFTRPTKGEIMFAYRRGLPIFISSSFSTILNGSTVFILGFFVSESIVGYYAGFDKLVRGCLILFTPITTAIYPHVSVLLSENKHEGITYIRKSALITISLAVLLSFVVSLFSKWIIPILFTKDFLQYTPLLYILLIWMIFSVSNNFIGLQYMTCVGQSRLYAVLFIICSITALFLIFILTPSMSCYGTALSILIGESLLTLLMLSVIKIKRL